MLSFPFQRVHIFIDSSHSSRALKASSASSAATTRSLSDLRLKYATLLEDHGSKVALLHRRETELQTIQERERGLEEQIESLEAQNETLQETLSRAEQRATLAEREVGFQQAMLVCIIYFLRLTNAYSRARRVSQLRKLLIIARTPQSWMKSPSRRSLNWNLSL